MSEKTLEGRATKLGFVLYDTTAERLACAAGYMRGYQAHTAKAQHEIDNLRGLVRTAKPFENEARIKQLELKLKEQKHHLELVDEERRQLLAEVMQAEKSLHLACEWLAHDSPHTVEQFRIWLDTDCPPPPPVPDRPLVPGGIGYPITDYERICIETMCPSCIAKVVEKFKGAAVPPAKGTK